MRDLGMQAVGGREPARRLLLPGLVVCHLLLLPGVVGAEEEPLPCRPAKPDELALVDVAVPAAADVRNPERRLFTTHITNRSGRMVCRVLARVTVGGRGRAAACYPEDAAAVGADGQLLCTFTEGADGQPSPPARGGRRRRGGQASASAGKAKLVVTGLELADMDAFKAWQARRAAPSSQPASAPAAPRGFRHVLKLTRASDGKVARQELDRAIGRLRECLLRHARKNPKLTVQATLRLGVSTSHVDNGETESFLAVKVLGPPVPAPEIRDCVRVLDLVVVAPGTDFLATADVRYDGDGKPPPERVEPDAAPVKSQPGQRQKQRRGRGGMSRSMGR